MPVRQRSWSSADAPNKPMVDDAGPRWFGINQDAPRTGWKAIVKHQGKTFFLLLAVWCAFIYYIRLPPSNEREFAELAPELAAAVVANSTEPPANLHLLIPASSGDDNLCKVMVSAGVLGYPTPVILNWNHVFDQDFVDGGSHLAKISATHDYLSRMDASKDGDLLVVVDGFDTWFQLRPQTLIDRYFAINRRADERINARMGGTYAEHGIRQEIVFGSQKRCWPWKPNDTACYAVPHSDLPKDIYGPDTDTESGDEANPYVKFRPRFLNSGVVMGTIRAMRKLFEQAMRNLEHEKNFGSDQFIFSHIYGDQEVWREAVRLDSLSDPSKLGENFSNASDTITFNPDHIEAVRQIASLTPDKNFEFGLGVDFRSEIGLNTVFAEDDTAWLTWSNKSQITSVLNDHSIPPQTSRFLGNHAHQAQLPPDILNSLPPFWTFNQDPSLPRTTPWSSVPLFTNLWTAHVPAVIHHNAHRDGRKALREEWWDRPWYFKHLRTLYDTSIYEPLVPLAWSGYNEDGSDARAYWPSERWKGGGRDGTKMFDGEPRGAEGWVKFDDVCKEFHEEIFRDGQGPWILPVVH